MGLDQRFKPRYNFLNNSLTFESRLPKVQASAYKKTNYYQMIRFHNIRLLGADGRKALIRRLLENDTLFGFFEHEYNRHYESHLIRRVDFSIKIEHVELIKQILNHNRSDLMYGYMFLLQNVINDVIVDPFHLDLLLNYQIAPKLTIPLDPNNALYAFPYYESLSAYDVVDYNFQHLKNSRIKKNEKSAHSFPKGSKTGFMFIFFMCDDRNLTYDEFLKDPVFNFNHRESFPKTYDAQKWFHSVDGRIDLSSLLALNRSEITLIVSGISLIKEVIDGTFNDGLKEALKSRERFVGIPELSNYLIHTDEMHKVLRTLKESSLHNLTEYRYDRLRYYICYLLVNHSVDDANELISVFSSMDDRRFFEYENNLIATMEFFEDDRTMSLDMWLSLGSQMDEFNDFLLYMY